MQDALNIDGGFILCSMGRVIVADDSARNDAWGFRQRLLRGNRGAHLTAGFVWHAVLKYAFKIHTSIQSLREHKHGRS